MMTLNSLLVGILAGLITFKVILLAVAAVLVAHGLATHVRRRKAAPVREQAPVPVPVHARKTAKHRRLDVYA